MEQKTVLGTPSISQNTLQYYGREWCSMLKGEARYTKVHSDKFRGKFCDSNHSSTSTLCFRSDMGFYDTSLFVSLVSNRNSQKFSRFHIRHFAYWHLQGNDGRKKPVRVSSTGAGAWIRAWEPVGVWGSASVNYGISILKTGKGQVRKRRRVHH